MTVKKCVKGVTFVTFLMKNGFKVCHNISFSALKLIKSEDVLLLTTYESYD